MLSWLKKFLRSRSSDTLPRDCRSLIDREAIDIVRTLNKAGYETYIVGGCVRDLLLGIAPKDFDIATQATPQQVKALISRAFVIGRRFRIVVAKRWPKGYRQKKFSATNFDIPLSRPKENEYQITTFRRDPVEVNGEINENVFGTAEQDAKRRDFTLNALFLEPESLKVVDFVSGLPDLRQKKLRVIGDPEIRFKEDPIRLLRALRFVMRADLSMSSQTAKAFRSSLEHLATAKRERVREELLKIMREGHSKKTWQKFRQLGVWALCYPLCADLIEKRPQFEKQLMALSDAIDKLPWKHSHDSSPLFAPFLIPFLLDESDKEGRVQRFTKDPSSQLDALLDELKMTRKEREDFAQAYVFLQRARDRDPQASRADSAFEKISKYPEDSLRCMYIMRILADAGLSNWAKVWAKWEGPWKLWHDKRLATQLADLRSSQTGASKGRSRSGSRGRRGASRGDRGGRPQRPRTPRPK